MKKKLCVLAAFIVLNVAAQSSLDFQSDLNDPSFAYTELQKNTVRKAAISLQIDLKKEVLKVRSTMPINELSINNLYGKNLIRRTHSNKVKLSSLPRGVYELEVKLTGTTFRKRIILE